MVDERPSGDQSSTINSCPGWVLQQSFFFTGDQILLKQVRTPVRREAEHEAAFVGDQPDLRQLWESLVNLDRYVGRPVKQPQVLVDAFFSALYRQFPAAWRQHHL